MGLKSKLIGQCEVKCHGDVFHEIWKDRPHYVANISPRCVQNISLLEGTWGDVGSVILMNYTHEGKEKVAKHLIEHIDEEKKTIKFTLKEGDLLEEYKSFSATLHVDTSGDDHLVSWTLEYEKLHEDTPELTTLLQFGMDMLKDIEDHHGPKND